MNLFGGAVAAGGLGYLLSQGEPQLPSEFTTAAGYAPAQYAAGTGLMTTGEQITGEAAPYLRESRQLFGAGQQELTAGEAALAAAQSGQLTPAQQATLGQIKDAETNQAMQMYASMGRNPTRDTSFLGTEEQISSSVLAAANQFMQTNIAAAGQMISAATGEFGAAASAAGVGTGLISAGASVTGLGLNFESAAANNLIAAGQAQVQNDQAYQQAVAGAFAAVGKVIGGGPTVVKA
jgi:hypothetical protein